ncbi:hypothetical protein [Pseudoalteromonas luteoviolacea]|uniref:Uncharacterized protein n=1 Tax=Pseudoalteromonas luteoviolacea DSM 6061 TaxID=1365250 RepID=A0A167BDL5_9GAMM|nr:hypothetical protein [Pseudoalteromonas luteoviolacea]KZN46420.1 hypothetical protein N475_25670 [Pseudoalteromonas luteoviolacea DSM 6061]MBE0388767.1 hypothetical protein [Pseudoalteromonas luteoviolacea DSM 6061]
MTILFFLALFTAKFLVIDSKEMLKEDKFNFDIEIINSAMKVYFKENGKNVDAIEELVPKYLSAIPNCPYEGVYMLKERNGELIVVCE